MSGEVVAFKCKNRHNYIFSKPIMPNFTSQIFFKSLSLQVVYIIETIIRPKQCLDLISIVFFSRVYCTIFFIS